MHPAIRPRSYRAVWFALFLGWVVSYIDRTLAGPVITWMIDSQASFLRGVESPHALGGLIGSLFFAGYMLTQFPGGYFGDKYGHRTVVLVSVFWAGVTTLLTGMVGGLFMFVALRVLTGLGEGAFYSNDRALIARVTPPERVGLGMGVVISGLTVGLTLALLAVPLMVRWAEPWAGEEAWRTPFLAMSVPTFLVGIYLSRVLPRAQDGRERAGAALRGLGGYAAVFAAVILAVYWLATRFAVRPSTTGLFLAGLAVLFVAYIYLTKGSEIRPVLINRDLLLVYVSAIPILWHLWLYSYWSVDIIKDTGSTFMAAALTASFNAIAGVIGFPLGGWLSDRAVKAGYDRKWVLVLLTAAEVVTIVGFGVYVMSGVKSTGVLAAGLFLSGLFFFALQSVSHALTAELAPSEHRGTAFGLWNLIAEIGALLSPVVSGTLRDSSGSWAPAIFLDAGLMTASCGLVLLIRVQGPRVRAVCLSNAGGRERLE